MIHPALLGWAQQCFYCTAPPLVEFSRSDTKTTLCVFYKEELCRALLQCLSLQEWPENRIWLELSLFSRAKFTASFLRPALDPFHWGRNFSPLLWGACPGFSCPAQEHSALLPGIISLQPHESRQLPPAGWGGRAELSWDSEWPSTSLVGELSGDNEEGRQSSRNLSLSTHWGLNCSCAALRCLDHCNVLEVMHHFWKPRSCSWWVSSKTSAFGGISVSLKHPWSPGLQLNQL